MEESYQFFQPPVKLCVTAVLLVRLRKLLVRSGPSTHTILYFSGKVLD